MAGIYVHIPFCRKACHYCNFHFSTSAQNTNELVNAITNEITLQRNYLQGEGVSTIYFGGGTPSLLRPDELRSILENIRSTFIVDDDAEVTLEANPDDVGNEKLDAWKQLGFNRLSIGVQSFFDDDLKWMNRAHNAQQATDCIILAQQAGFINLTIDLIYGTPTLSDENWKLNVDRAIGLQVPHLSCYALTVEPNTALNTLIQKKQLPDVDADTQARHFELLMQWMNAAGYQHYEVSNFAKPGWHGRHNSSYWQGKKYLGLGPSAHSFNGISRQWNVANNALYTQALQKNELLFEVENLTPKQQLNEYIMTSLRTLEGIDLDVVNKRFGEKTLTKLTQQVQRYIHSGQIIDGHNHYILSCKGKLLADGIASDLFQL